MVLAARCAPLLRSAFACLLLPVCHLPNIRRLQNFALPSNLTQLPDTTMFAAWFEISGEGSIFWKPHLHELLSQLSYLSSR